MDKYEAFIKQFIADRRGHDIDDIDVRADMFERHYIDSLGVFTLLLEIEDAFDVHFNDEDMTEGKMLSIQGIAQVTAAKHTS